MAARIPNIHLLNSISLSSKVGELTLYENDNHIVAVTWERQPSNQPTPLLREAKKQVEAYFKESRHIFDLPLSVGGSRFQRDVCNQMLRIPYGETWTYGDIAAKLKTSAQPVGGACGRNPIPIIIPCHRVMGADDKMTGFSGAGGVATKTRLLAHEGWRPKAPDLFD